LVKLTKLVQLRTDSDKAGTALPTVLFRSITDGTCTCSMAAKLHPNTILVHLYLKRTVDACTGTVSYYPKSGSTAIVVANKGVIALPITSQNIKYAASVDAEAWDHYLLAYTVEGERKTR